MAELIKELSAVTTVFAPASLGTCDVSLSAPLLKLSPPALDDRPSAVSSWLLLDFDELRGMLEPLFWLWVKEKRTRVVVFLSYDVGWMT